MGAPNSPGEARDKTASLIKPPRAIAKNPRLPSWAPWILRMRQIRRNFPDEMQKHGRGMLVGGHRFAKRHVPQMLQRIRQSVIGRLARLPQTDAFCKFLRCKRR